MDIKTEVLFLTLIIAVLNLITLMLVKNQQKKISFIHPGWILIVVNIFYAIFVPISYIIYGDNLHEVYSDVYRYFNKMNFLKVIYMYIAISLGFLYAQSMVWITKRIRIRSSALVDSSKVNDGKINKKLLNRIILILPLIGIYIIFMRFSAVGGFFSALTLNRRDLGGAIAESLVFGRYEYFFQIFFILSFALMLNGYYKKAKTKFVLVLMLYVAYMLLNGIRLPIIVILLSLVFLLYSNTLRVVFRNKTKVFVSEFWANNKRKILVFSVMIFIFFGWYTFQRASIRSTLVGQEIELNEVNLGALVFPQEFSTGYVPGLMQLNHSFGDLGSAYWKKFIPGSVLSFVGIDKGITVTQDLAWRLHGVGRAPVYTVTLPIDIYSATNSYIMVFIIGSILYLAIYMLFEKLSRYGFWGNTFSALLFLNLFYVIRVEAGSWFPRIWQGGLIFFVIMIIYKLLSKISIRDGMRIE